MSTVLTIVYVPILYSLFEDAASALRRRFGHQPSGVGLAVPLPPGAP